MPAWRISRSPRLRPADTLAQAEFSVHPRRPIRPAAHAVDVDDGVGQVGVVEIPVADRVGEPRRTRRSTPSSRDNTSPPAGPGSPCAMKANIILCPYVVVKPRGAMFGS